MSSDSVGEKNREIWGGSNAPWSAREGLCVLLIGVNTERSCLVKDCFTGE